MKMTLLFPFIALVATSGEIGYDLTTGELFVQTTFVYNQLLDEEYNAMPGQAGQRIISGDEALSMMPMHILDEAQRFYLEAMLTLPGAKAVAFEPEIAGGVVEELYVFFPTYTDVGLELPAGFAGKAGLWVTPFAGESSCQWVMREWGQQGVATGCHCYAQIQRCCDGQYCDQGACQPCQAPGHQRNVLELRFGPDLRRDAPRPIETVDIGERLDQITYQ